MAGIPQRPVYDPMVVYLPAREAPVRHGRCAAVVTRDANGFGVTVQCRHAGATAPTRELAEASFLAALEAAG